MELMTPDLVSLDADLGATKEDVIGSLAQLVANAGRADASGLKDDAMAREGMAATGLPGGIAIPHCRSAAVSQASLAFARLSNKVDFGAKDGPADIVFLIAAAAEGDADHLKLLTQLARALVRKDFLASLRAARDNQLATGAEKRNVVFVVREASLQAVLDELRRKERELDLAERGAGALLGQFTTGGHHA